MMTFILLGDWVSESEEPDKVSFMWLGRNQRGMSHDSKNNEQLRTHYQQLFGKELSKDNIESLISCNFSAIEGHPELEIQVFNSSRLLQELLGPEVVCALKFNGEECQEIKHNKRYFKRKFDKDKLFCCRLMRAPEQHLQRFLFQTTSLSAW